MKSWGLKMKSQSHKNRGKMLEKLIDTTNHYYKHHSLAFIQKVPTPFKVLGMDRGGRLMKGHYERGEWVDYVGVTLSKGIAFDAKQTAKKNFPLDSLHDHQYKFLDHYHKLGHDSFLIIEFTELNEYYLLPFEILKDYWKAYKNLDKKHGDSSISYKAFQYDAIKVEKKGTILEYLEALEKYKKLGG